MSIATFHQAGRFGRRTTQTARSRAEVAALLGRGTQPRACTRSVQRILRPEEADAISPWMCRTVGALLGAMPGAQQQVSFSLLAEAHVPAAAIAAARAAGLEPGKPGDEVDAILSVAMGAPLPAGTNRAAARAGVALLPAAPRLRLRGQRAIGAGGAVSAGAVEDASLTARARAGLQLDHPVSPSEAPALLAALTGNASNYS